MSSETCCELTECIGTESTGADETGREVCPNFSDEDNGVVGTRKVKMAHGLKLWSQLSTWRERLRS